MINTFGALIVIVYKRREASEHPTTAALPTSPSLPTRTHLDVHAGRPRHVVSVYAVTANIVMAYIAMPYKVMSHIVMASTYVLAVRVLGPPVRPI